MLRELAVEIAQRRLEDWESPAMVVESLALLYRCLSGMDEFEVMNSFHPFDPTEDTETRSKRNIESRTNAFHPFDPTEDTETHVIIDHGHGRDHFPPIRSDRGY